MRKSGILVHPTSFPSEFGIGDILYGFEFVDFLVSAGQSLWQILPLGHTSFGDSPYQSFSTFAGNPLLISPRMLEKEGLLEEKDFLEKPEFEKRKVEYEKVIKFKESLFKKAFKRFDRENEDFLKFCFENKFWLDDYALFIALKEHFIKERKFSYESDEYKKYYKMCSKILSENEIKDCFYGGAWNSFPPLLRDRDKEEIEKYSKMLEEEILYFKFLQYQFFTQWASLKEYANKNGIKIIGDIPIFVASDSSDTWCFKELFYINQKGFTTEVAGVPPDYFSEDGQLWGNPLYNWKNHKKENYKWWVSRVNAIFKCVDIVRIDHFRGFESYWAIKMGEKTAVNGKWKKGPRKEIFEVIRKELGEVEIIAEDLGDLNEEVIKLRKELSLAGMKILEFAFDDFKNDYLPHNYESVNYVVYTGTHDNDTVLGWYSSLDEKSSDIVRRYMNVSGQDICWDMIRLCFSTIAKYAIIPIQDLMCLGSESRMNLPGSAKGNWQFRFEKEMLKEDMAKGLLYLSKVYNRN